MAMRVVVTGGAGTLGSPVCKELADSGFEVRAVDRIYRREVPVPLEVADLLDAQAAYRLLKGCAAVVHLANHPNPHGHLPPQRLYIENVAMDMNVFQAAADLGVRKIVFASSVQVFSGDRTTDDLDRPSCLAYLPIDGDMPACPRNSYALSKETGEQQLRYFASLDRDLACVALRFPALRTPWHMQWLGKVGPRAPRPYATHPDEGFGYLTVEDAGRLVVAVLLKLPPGYHQFLPAAPDNSFGMSTSEMIEKFYAGVPIRKPIEGKTSVIDTSAITEQVGWTPRDAAFSQEG